MNKKYFFISGLPRSGSTLLVNILNQNPEVYASPTSGLLQVVKPVINGWNNISEFKANSTSEHKRGLLRGIIDGYYSCREEDIIFDKGRGWPAEMEMLEYITGEKPKIILCVRDVRDILSSWEGMYRRDKLAGNATPGESENPGAFTTVESRCEFWSSATSPLGGAFNVMRDAFHRGYGDSLYYFEYEKWTTNPVEEFNKLHEWLGMIAFSYDFNNVKQVITEKDEYYGYNDLHTIKEGPVIPSAPKWQNLLTEDLGTKYAGSNIWRND